MTTQSDEIAALKERIATLEGDANALADSVLKLITIVRKDHAAPASPEYRKPIAPNHAAGVPFVLQRFNEAAETSVQAVKAEIDASITLVAQKLGLAEMRARSAALSEGDSMRPLATRLTFDVGGDEEPQS